MPCPRCGGRGWYAYDENHGKPCEVCCQHDKGVWQLREHYRYLNEKWCCRAGCGTVWDTEEDYERRNDGNSRID